MVLLYGSEMWVLYPRIGGNLGGFHHKVVHRFMGRHTRRMMDGTWVYPSLGEIMEEAGLHEVYTYVSHHQNTVT